MRRLTALTFALWAIVGVVLAGPASAHASLVASNPRELQILSDPPSAVLLVFDDAVQPELSTVRLTSAAGTAVPVGPLSHGRYGTSYVLAPVAGRMVAGDYEVSWRTVSTDDGHATEGSFSFRTVGSRSPTVAATDALRAPAQPQVSSDGARAVYGVSRWLAFLGFACCLGISFFLVACQPHQDVRRALRRLAAGGWVATVLATLGMLASFAAAAESAPLGTVLDGSSLGATVGTHVGAVLLVRLGCLVVMAPLGWRLLRRPSPYAGSVVLAGGGVLADTWSAISHSGAAWQTEILDVAHLVAIAVWLGGLVALGSVVLRHPENRTVTRFSRVALVSVVVLVGTGTVQAWRQTGSLGSLSDNEYGRLLLAKISLVLVTLGLAAIARFRLLKATPLPGRLRRVVMAEAGLGVAVLTVTSVLVTAAPARTAHEDLLAARRASRSAVASEVRRAPVTIQSLSGTVPYDAGIGPAGKGAVHVSVSPTRPGATQIHLTFLDLTGRPQALTRLAVALRPLTGDRTAVAVTFTRVSVGHYVSDGAAFGASGAWQVGIALGLPSGHAAVAIAGVDVQ